MYIYIYCIYRTCAYVGKELGSLPRCFACLRHYWYVRHNRGVNDVIVECTTLSSLWSGGWGVGRAVGGRLFGLSGKFTGYREIYRVQGTLSKKEVCFVVDFFRVEEK